MAVRPRRLFADALPEAGGEVVLPPESAEHARVLRLTRGTTVELFDGQAGEAQASLTELSRTRAVCLAQPRRSVPPPAATLHVVLALPKGKKLEDITRMLTELGISSLHLALSERSVPRPAEATARLARLRRIALEACAQSGQACAPELHPPRPLLAIAAAIPAAARKLVFWEHASAPLDAVLGPVPGTELWVVIGPEGGLGDDEVGALRALGFAEVGLGHALLRVQTAVPVIAALLLERIGRLRG
jgi:16S rRNA (uracil1498-N3)-methyltransferase